jgi:hypothetical protein
LEGKDLHDHYRCFWTVAILKLKQVIYWPISLPGKGKEITEYKRGLAFSGMMFIPSIMKVLVQKILEATDTQT